MQKSVTNKVIVTTSDNNIFISNCRSPSHYLDMKSFLNAVFCFCFLTYAKSHVYSKSKWLLTNVN